MKKQLLVRIALGAPLGAALSYFITLAISLSVGDGNYYPIVPELAADFGSELNATLVQFACSLLYGGAFAGASVIWEMERWSLTRMTLTHLAVVCVCTFPVAWLLRWMPHTALGALCYFAIFFGIYLVIWLSQYSAMKRRIAQMNGKLSRKGQEKPQ